VFIQAENINEAWQRVLNAIWYSGCEFSSQRGKTKEIHNLFVRINKPEDDEVDGFPMDGASLAEYAQQLLNPDRQGFAYTYGERLRAWGGGLVDAPVDQLTRVGERLRANSNTRRATAVTWMPPKDLLEKEVPCLVLADFKVRDGLQHLTAVFRSNDMYAAWPANGYGLNQVNRFVADISGAEAGSLSTLSISAHIYEHDFKNVERILGLV